MAGRSKASGSKGKGAKKRAARKPRAKARKSPKPKDDNTVQATGQQIESFVRDLTGNEQVALTIRDELYSGSWERMREDLESRSAGRPYVFRLASRIEEDLRIIEKLSAFEQQMGINLSDYVEEGR
jgi:hypothetical protein